MSRVFRRYATEHCRSIDLDGAANMGMMNPTQLDDEEDEEDEEISEVG
jgi:hypothetical protein